MKIVSMLLLNILCCNCLLNLVLGICIFSLVITNKCVPNETENSFAFNDLSHSHMHTKEQKLALFLTSVSLRSSIFDVVWCFVLCCWRCFIVRGGVCCVCVLFVFHVCFGNTTTAQRKKQPTNQRNNSRSTTHEQTWAKLPLLQIKQAKRTQLP